MSELDRLESLQRSGFRFLPVPDRKWYWEMGNAVAGPFPSIEMAVDNASKVSAFIPFYDATVAERITNLAQKILAEALANNPDLTMVDTDSLTSDKGS